MPRNGNCGYYLCFKGFDIIKTNYEGKKSKTCIKQNESKKVKKELVNSGKKIALPLLIIKLINEGHMHLFGFNGSKNKTQDKRDNAFMEACGNNIFYEDFDDQDENNINISVWMEATITLPIIALKYKVSITMYNLPHYKESYNALVACSPTTNYFYYNGS